MAPPLPFPQRTQRLAQSPDPLLNTLRTLVGGIQAERLLVTPIGMERLSHDKGYLLV